MHMVLFRNGITSVQLENLSSNLRTSAAAELCGLETAQSHISSTKSTVITKCITESWT